MTKENNTVPGALAALDEQMLTRWLKERLQEGDLEPADLAQLAARYALAEREPLLQELRERIQAWDARYDPDLETLRDVFSDASERGQKYGFTITRANVVEVMREELALAGFEPAEMGPSLDASILAMFQGLAEEDDMPPVRERTSA